jgi:hypothetical protein
MGSSILEKIDRNKILEIEEELKKPLKRHIRRKYHFDTFIKSYFHYTRAEWIRLRKNFKNKIYVSAKIAQIKKLYPEIKNIEKRLFWKVDFVKHYFCEDKVFYVIGSRINRFLGFQVKINKVPNIERWKFSVYKPAYPDHNNLIIHRASPGLFYANEVKLVDWFKCPYKQAKGIELDLISLIWRFSEYLPKSPILKELAFEFQKDYCEIYFLTRDEKIKSFRLKAKSDLEFPIAVSFSARNAKLFLKALKNFYRIEQKEFNQKRVKIKLARMDNYLIMRSRNLFAGFRCTPNRYLYVVLKCSNPYIKDTSYSVVKS